jgi:hypothetical protein
MIRSPGAEPRDQVKRKRALQGCNHRRGITWWGLIRADVGSVGESTRSRAASSLGCCFGCCLSPTSDEKTPACLENPLPCFPCATQAHPLVVALYSRGSRPEFADAFLRQITTSNRDDFLSKARAGTIPIQDFKRRIDFLIQQLRQSPKARGSDRIYIPGEIEWEKREDALRNGIPLPELYLSALYQAGKDLGVDTRLLG